ncbi:hypothetical protein [Nocardia arthritidis]|uniref:Uncharacterized protein n=1 Tax=Nocardia arthritidis TaxID=228602 RepID=A0A6G9YFD0_9NOCA|nr:hypothetical protein [Nocardia arthritidis]QIS11898.1 hypothetical protein F5544_20165 [Nocardia arthritidis]
MGWLRRLEKRLEKQNEEYLKARRELSEARLRAALSMTGAERAEAKLRADDDFERRRRRRNEQARAMSRNTSADTSTGSASIWRRTPTSRVEYPDSGWHSPGSGLWSDLDHRD